MPDSLSDFTKGSFTSDGKTRDVYRVGAGPAVIVISEIPGITPLVAQFGTGIHTALTDTGGHSFDVLAYDAHHDYFDYAATVLPGAAVDFSIIFSIPADAKPESLVFTISRYEDRGEPSKHTDVRVKLN